MKIEQKKSEYQLQAEKFLADTKTSFEAELVGHGPYSEGDTESRDIYKITLTRQELRPFIFKFGQSIVHSGPSIKEDYKYSREFMRSGRMVAFKPEHFEQKRQAPNAYIANGYTRKQWREYLVWLAGVIYGLKTAKNI